MKISVLIVDDHDMLRILLRERLNRDPRIEVVGEARNGYETIRKARELQPDLIILDIELPDISGLQVTRRLRRLVPGARIIGLSMHRSGPVPMRILELGAAGYLTKASAPEALISAVDRVMRGNRYVDPVLAQTLMLDSLEGNHTPLDALSTRELEVLSHIVRGARIKDIAESLSRSPKTISTLRSRIFRKLDAKSDVELTLIAMRLGFVEPSTVGEHI